MSALAKLKLVNSKRSRTFSPIVHRRNKLIAKITEQIELATAQKEGRLYAPVSDRCIGATHDRKYGANV
jgi:hypothetical protein